MRKGGNKVWLVGKISQQSPLKYTPSGLALLEFTIASIQTTLEKDSVGYFDVIVQGPKAEDTKDLLKVGKEVQVYGSLFQRSFRNRLGLRVSEVKILFDKFGGDHHEKDGRR